MNYTLKSGFEEMDWIKVTDMLSTACWSPGIQIDEVREGARHSALVVGAFDLQNRQIGFARVISDKTRFAYILDVIVDENHRKKGIGQSLMKHILACPELGKVYQWLLVTRDAHGVYEKSGFKITERARDWMEIRKSRAHSKHK